MLKKLSAPQNLVAALSDYRNAARKGLEDIRNLANNYRKEQLAKTKDDDKNTTTSTRGNENKEQDVSHPSTQNSKSLKFTQHTIESPLVTTRGRPIQPASKTVSNKDNQGARSTDDNISSVNVQNSSSTNKSLKEDYKDKKSDNEKIASRSNGKTMDTNNFYDTGLTLMPVLRRAMSDNSGNDSGRQPHKFMYRSSPRSTNPSAGTTDKAELFSLFDNVPPPWHKSIIKDASSPLSHEESGCSSLARSHLGNENETDEDNHDGPSIGTSAYSLSK